MLTTKQAYDKGWASAGTNADWDDALVRFSDRYCPPHPVTRMCDLEQDWADGWSDRLAGRPKGHAMRCDGDGHRGHDECEVL